MSRSVIGLMLVGLATWAVAGEPVELTADSMTAAFSLMAEKIRPTLPQLVDAETLWYDMTVGPGPRANYFYCIYKYPAKEADQPLLASRIEPLLRKGVCANSNIKLALAKGAVYSYTYIGSDEVELVKLEFDRHSCSI